MTYALVDRYFSGQGELLIAERDSVTGLPLGYRPVGNVPDLKITNAPSNLEHKESRTGNRSTDLRLQTELKVGFSFTLENLNKENLALALRGKATSVVGASVTAEASKVYLGLVMALKHAKVSAVVVKKAAATLVAYTNPATPYDYKVNAAMGSIEWSATPSTSGLVDGDEVAIDYTHAAQEVVEGLTEGTSERFLRFEGLNTADENSPVIVDIFRAAADPLKELALISDTVGQFVLEGSIYADPLRPAGTSPYYSAVIV